jgi:chromosome segregation ATPase
VWAFLLARPKLIAGGLIIVLLAGAFVWWGNSRSAAGYASGQRAQLETDKTQFTQLQQQYQSTLAAQQAKIDASDAQLTILKTLYQSLSSQFALLQSQRQQQQAQVAQLPDSQVRADLEVKLGGSLEEPSILRKDDAIVTDYPLALKSIETLTQKVSNLDSTVVELGHKVDAIAAQRDASIQFGNNVVALYTRAYNAAQVHHSRFVKIITFGLVRDKHLNLPEPTTLKP